MKTIEDANAHIFHLETKTSSSQSNETIADVNASDFIWNPILVKSVKWNTNSCKCTCDSYKVKSSSNQSKETFGNANTLLFHKFLSCIVIRQQIANLDSSFQGLDQCPKLTPLEQQQVLTHPEKIRVTNPPITSVYNNLLTSIIATVVSSKGPTFVQDHPLKHLD